MRRLALFVIATCFLTAALTGVAVAAYNPVPAGDAQYQQCLRQSVNNYTGGMDSSPIKGQTKVEAFCTCMWNETPDDFKGNLGSFAETPKGAGINKTCEKYSAWQD